jgi:hypothetical protein
MMSHLTSALGVLLASLITLAGWNVARATDISPEPSPANVDFVQGNGRLAVVIDGMPVAVYFYESKRITRPFFADVRTTTGVQVTRRHPPIMGHDLVDHETMHSGIWMSFGDISGYDYWRNKGNVKHVEFVQPPQRGRGRGSFAVRNHFLDQSDSAKPVCQEIARYTFLTCSEGYVILWDTTFTSDREFSFGDQEEMGLAARVATSLRVGASGAGMLPAGVGTITNSEFRENEDATWGRTADWCSFGGTIAGQSVGLTIFCHPDNFRPSWFHARNYGLLVANPFGRHAFGKGEKSNVSLQPGQELRLRYGVMIHSIPAESKLDLGQAYRDYLHVAGN